MSDRVRQGDACYLLLNFDVEIDDETTVTLAEFIEVNAVDEIELTIGKCRFTLSGGDIHLDEVLGKYFVAIPQEASFNFRTFVDFQLRLKRGGFLVSSSEIYHTKIGRSLSREVL